MARRRPACQGAGFSPTRPRSSCAFLHESVSFEPRLELLSFGVWRAQCHTNNVRAGDETRCALPTRAAVDLHDFQKQLKTAALHTAAMLGAAYSTGRDVYEVRLDWRGRGRELIIAGAGRRSTRAPLLP